MKMTRFPLVLQNGSNQTGELQTLQMYPKQKTESRTQLAWILPTEAILQTEALIQEVKKTHLEKHK